jgi:hypothetical protein
MVDTTRRSILKVSVALGGLAAIGPPAFGFSRGSIPACTPTPARERRVGVAYSLWHYPPVFGEYWQNVWGTPELGTYVSDDRAIIRKHAAWLVEAGVDFVLVDCSNEIRTRNTKSTPWWRCSRNSRR